jgi:SMC interacting uncharacterized protein involved in chromosome segregation
MVDLDKWKSDVEESLRRAEDAFNGMYAHEIKGLLELSRKEIDAIMPGTTDIQTYDKLIVIVKEASRHNVSQAELKARIEQLGEVGIDIAKKVARLAALFA